MINFKVHSSAISECEAVKPTSGAKLSQLPLSLLPAHVSQAEYAGTSFWGNSYIERQIIMTCF